MAAKTWHCEDGVGEVRALRRKHGPTKTEQQHMIKVSYIQFEHEYVLYTQTGVHKTPTTDKGVMCYRSESEKFGRNASVSSRGAGAGGGGGVVRIIDEIVHVRLAVHR